MFPRCLDGKTRKFAGRKPAVEVKTKGGFSSRRRAAQAMSARQLGVTIVSGAWVDDVRPLVLLHDQRQRRKELEHVVHHGLDLIEVARVVTEIGEGAGKLSKAESLHQALPAQQLILPHGRRRLRGNAVPG